MSQLNKATRAIGWFVLWTGLFVLLYIEANQEYLTAVIAVADSVTRAAFDLNLNLHPNGLVITGAGVAEPLGLPYNFRTIGLNVVFAPALVLATLGASIAGAIRAAIAILLMIVLHAAQTLSIVLVYAVHPDTSGLDLGFASAAFATSVTWVYQFIDRMSYALFPFLVWAVLCPDAIASFWRKDSVQPEAD
jgi:hypothetical protein